MTSSATPAQPGNPEPLRNLPLATITERWPMTLTVFHAHGMDACCGGQLALSAAAKIHGLDIDALEAELHAVAPASTVGGA
jgi:iron-sulfur cluster repair protein YtfE (RIC family)